MLNSANLPAEIPVARVKKIAEMLGVEPQDFHSLVKITITSTHVEILWEDLYEIDHLHRAAITK
jgi:hypothetical protein